jgi:hypothetical protein
MLDQTQIIATRKKFLNPVFFRGFMLKMLPMGFLSGMRIAQLDDELCEVRLTYSWLIKNPFRSTFWAVLGMAAEMSTGALLVSYTRNQPDRISFILIENEAKYYKKGRGKMRFICNYSAQVKQTVLQAMKDNEKHEIQLPVRVLNASGELIAEMSFTWVVERRGE